MPLKTEAPAATKLTGATDPAMLEDLQANYNALGNVIESLKATPANNRNATCDIMDGYPIVGTVKDAAKFLGVSPATVRKMCRDEQLRAKKCGNPWRIPREWLREFIEGGGCDGRVAS